MLSRHSLIIIFFFYYQQLPLFLRVKFWMKTETKGPTPENQLRTFWLWYLMWFYRWQKTLPRLSWDPTLTPTGCIMSTAVHPFPEKTWVHTLHSPVLPLPTRRRQLWLCTGFLSCSSFPAWGQLPHSCWTGLCAATPSRPKDRSRRKITPSPQWFIWEAEMSWGCRLWGRDYVNWQCQGKKCLA